MTNPLVLSGDDRAAEAAGRSGPSPQWFAVYTTPRHEKSVARHFAVREIEAFLPLYRSVRRWKNGCRVSVEQPLFPNYLFVSLERPEYSRVLQTPGVLSLVGSGRQPSPLEASE